MAQSDSSTPIHRASTYMDTLRCKWNGVFYNIFEFEIMYESLCNMSRKIEYSRASHWSIFHRRPERDHMAITITSFIIKASSWSLV